MYSKQQTPILNPKGIDKVISRINLYLSNIDWLTKIYQRAWVLNDSISNENKNVAKVYLSQNEYLEPIPQDNEMGISFVMATSEEIYVGQDSGNSFVEQEKERNLAIIFSVNLKAIDPTLDYVFTEYLKEEVELALDKVDDLEIVSYIDEDYRKVFEGLNITNLTLMKYPYGAFRFNIKVYYGGQRNC
jgi:hypothetical protein